MRFELTNRNELKFLHRGLGGCYTMKKLSILAISIALCSCSTAPKDAAQKVCDCNKEALKAVTDDLSKANEQRKKCSDMADGFKKNYSKEELEAYNKALTECAIGSVLDAIK
jgi:hypothetical protein